jgi:putative membrane protein
VDKRDFPDAKPHECFLGRYLLFLLLSQIQAVVIVAGDLYLFGVQCRYPAAMFLVAMATSLTFSLLIYALTISFGDIGKALAVVVMVIQIAGSGGTYPIEALPSFFRAVYIFFPFPYAINAMRECIGGMYHQDLTIDLLKLGVFCVGALVIGLVVRIPFMGLNRFIEKRMEDTGMM